MKQVLHSPAKTTPRPLLLLGVSIFSLGIAALAAHAAPVGMAAQVKGKVEVESGGKKAPLKLLGRVESGDVVHCDNGAQAIIVFFKGGARYQIPANKSVTIGVGEVVGAPEMKMTAMTGPSAAVVQKLGNARVGAVMARPGTSFQRLKEDFPGWLPLDKPKFNWLTLNGAATYTFTLFDAYDNVVWSVKTKDLSADYPADAPELRAERPYLWRLSGFGESGKPVQDSRCGLVTFLPPASGATLTKMTGELQAQIKELETQKDESKGSDAKTALLLLAEVYRGSGVLGRTLEILEDERLVKEDGITEAKNEILNTLSPFARALMPSSQQ